MEGFLAPFVLRDLSLLLSLPLLCKQGKWAELGCAGVCWARPGGAKLGQAGLNWAELVWADRTELSSAELS